MKVKRMVLASASVLALITGLSVGNAHGQPAYVPHPVCTNAYSIAKDVMGMRQNNVPIEQVKGMIETELAIAIIDAAYDKVVVPKAERATLILDFAYDMFSVCDEELPGVVGIAL